MNSGGKWKRTQHFVEKNLIRQKGPLYLAGNFCHFQSSSPRKTRETLSFWTWDSQTGININVVILAVNVLLFWAVLIFTELNITKLLWIKMKEMVYGSKVAIT